MVTQTQGWRCTFNLVLLTLVSFGSLGLSEEIFLGKRPIDASSQLTAQNLPVGCADSTFTVRLVAVCPVSDGEEESLYFEEASHPVLSVEAEMVSPSGMNDPSVASALPDETLIRPQGMAAIQLANVNLINENLFKFGKSSTLNLSYAKVNAEAARVVGRGHSAKVQVRINVCQDNGTGKCADKDSKNNLTLRSHVFEACKIPKEVPIAVWAGCR